MVNEILLSLLMINFYGLIFCSWLISSVRSRTGAESISSLTANLLNLKNQFSVNSNYLASKKGTFSLFGVRYFFVGCDFKKIVHSYTARLHDNVFFCKPAPRSFRFISLCRWKPYKFKFCFISTRCWQRCPFGLKLPVDNVVDYWFQRCRGLSTLK